MDELLAALRTVLSNTFIGYFAFHSAHWNVQGPSFSEYHTFFGDLYLELQGAIDSIAEQIRIIDKFAPISIYELYEYKTIKETDIVLTDGVKLCQSLLNVNDEIIDSLNKVFSLANVQNNQGLINFIANRLEIHAKHQWMIKAHIL